MPHPPPDKNSTGESPTEKSSRDNSSMPARLPAPSISKGASAPASLPGTSAASPAPPSTSPDYAPESPARRAPKPKLQAAQKIADESGNAPRPNKSSSNTPPFFADTFLHTPAPPHDMPDQNSAPPAPPTPGSSPTASSPIPTARE